MNRLKLTAFLVLCFALTAFAQSGGNFTIEKSMKMSPKNYRELVLK